MVVLAIIAVLLGAGIYNMVGVLDIAREQRAASDIAGFESSLTQYQINSRGVYPTTGQGLAALVSAPTAPPLPRKWAQCMTQINDDPWGNPYKYAYPPTHNRSKPDIYSMGPDGKDGTADDIKNW